MGVVCQKGFSKILVKSLKNCLTPEPNKPLNRTQMDLWWTPDGDPDRDPWWRPQRRLPKETPRRDPDQPLTYHQDPQKIPNRPSTTYQWTPATRRPTNIQWRPIEMQKSTPGSQFPVLKTLPVRSLYHRWFQWGRERTSQISESGQPVWYCLWFGNIEATHRSTDYRNSVY